MRRTSVIAVASVLVASSMLAACGSDDPSSSSEASSSVSEQPTATEEPTVSGSDVGFEASGEIGDRPVLTFDGDTPPSGLQVSAVTEGDGEVVAPGSQVTVNYYGAVWGSQEPFDNSYDRGQSTSFGLNQVITGWTVGLEGQRVGSRVLITIPPDLGYGPSGGNGSIGAEDTIVFVVDILGTVGPDVTGQADATPTGAEVPVTWEGELGEPVTSVEVVAGTPEPTELVATVLAEGTGAPLAENDEVSFQYTLTTWDNADNESTWPALGGLGPQSAVVGFGSAFDSLVGVPVGSRILLQIPGNAEAETTTIALVVDLVASTPGAA